MREIKFRAWDKEKKIWVSNGEIEFSISEGTMVVCPNTVEHIGDSVHDMYVAERFDVQQYTCLKDKNGVEIYEGDILQDDIGFALPFVVEWHSMSDHSNWSSSRGNVFEVIGNIHENPELLKEGN